MVLHLLHSLRLPLHAVALASDVYVGWWVHRNCEPHTWPGHMAMLTHWGHFLQTIYFAVVLIQDIIWLFSKPAQPHLYQFWGLYFYNRELILPEALDATYPSHINMHQHGWTAVFMWVELLIRHHHNLTTKFEYILNLLLGLVYLLWTCVIAYVDHWPYPFQNELDLVGAIIFYMGSLMMTTVWTFIKRTICAALYGDREPAKVKAN